MRGVLLLLFAVSAPAALFAGGPPDPAITITGGTAVPGDSITSRLILENDTVANGWAFAICHDPVVVELISVDLGPDGATVNNGTSPDFFQHQLTDGGWAQSVVVNLHGTQTLPAGVFDLAVAEYTAVAPGVTTLCPCDLNLMPPIVTVIVYSGASLVPTANCEEIVVPAGPYFVRGDANADSSVDLADAVEVLNFLFAGALIACLEAGDVNSDAVVDIADPVALLGYLFSGGEAPAPPFPDCGGDETADCDAEDACA